MCLCAFVCLLGCLFVSELISFSVWLVRRLSGLWVGWLVGRLVGWSIV